MKVQEPAASIARRILVVDDSRAQRRLLCMSLQRGGYEVIEAGSAEEALDLCQSQDFAMVISDWVMPGMSGLDFCRAFRALPRETYAYFILLTSNSESTQVADGLDCGADDFLTKPVHSDELHARLRAGERILGMQSELVDKNRMISAAMGRLQQMHDNLNRDLIEARKVQQALIRDRYRDFGGATVSVLLRPSGHVGGDLAGFFQLAPGRVALFSVDVAGHGVASAMMTARLAGLFVGSDADQHIAFRDGKTLPPPAVAARLNNLILDELGVDQYLTLAYAELDLATGGVEMVQAGHPHPVVLRADGRVEFVGQGGLPVGLIPGAGYNPFALQLAAGDRLFLVSDGVTECMAPDGSELGQDGLDRILRTNAHLSPQDLLEALVWDLTDFTGGQDFRDDVSGVLLHYAGSPNA
ncbi:PP2C family protein-serine/threonine phosphatase [Neogemmobacter tilapiae]|nr:SpoIIE family protein phosphatase [Gemmobacter tilapiae]